MLGALSQVLDQRVTEGRLTRNDASLVDRVPGRAKKFETFTSDQVRTVLSGIARDRNRHAWHLALAGLRRGEIAGQRWADIDLVKSVTISVLPNIRAIDQVGKSAAQRPTVCRADRI
jgi:integrase